MDLHPLRVHEPAARARGRHARGGCVPPVSCAARDRAGYAAGPLAGAGEEEIVARAEITTPEALESERLTDAALRPSRLDEIEQDTRPVRWLARAKKK